MSTKTIESSGITSAFYSFPLKLRFKAKQLNDLEKSRNASILRSDLYEFKSAKNLHFYLEIPKPIDTRIEVVNIKGSKMWSFELAYALLVSKERAFKLKKSDHLSFLYSYSTSFVPDEEDVTIYCVVNACPAQPASSVKEDDLSLMKGQNAVYFDSMPLPVNHKNEMVINFMRKGDVPYFSVAKAIKIISEAKEHKCEALTILSAEYLTNNITRQNIKQISRVALDYHLLYLERKCLERIADGFYEIKPES